MRLNANPKTQRFIPALSFLLVSLLIVPALQAQNPDDLMPPESAAKAKAILKQAIEALGGEAFLNVRNTDCSGRYAQFEHSGAVSGYIEIREIREAPAKSRVEYDPKATIVDLYVGNQGWTMDRGGVTEEPAEVVADYQDSLQTDINNILRRRMDDPDLVFRYGGADVVNLMQADWVEIGDHQGHTIRVAINKSTHLPIQVVITKRDPKTGERTERMTQFTTYHAIDGVQIPFRTSRFLNGRQTYQVFLEGCSINATLPPDFFTRASLDQHFAQLNKRKKK